MAKLQARTWLFRALYPSFVAVRWPSSQSHGRWLKQCRLQVAAAAMAQNENTTEEHSTLEQQSPGKLDHPAWCVVWTVWPAFPPLCPDQSSASAIGGLGGATIEALRLVPAQIMGLWGTLYSVPPEIFFDLPENFQSFFFNYMLI